MTTITIKKAIRSCYGLIVLSLLLVSSPAFAVPITGSISFSDGFEALGGPNSIVSQLTSFNVFNNAAATQVSNCSGNFGACTPAAPIVNGGSSDFSFAGGLQTIYKYNGFEFKIASFDSITPTAFSCGAFSCDDALKFTGSGIVSGNGFDSTLFTIVWTAQGSCLGTGQNCTSNVSGSWSASISATGVQRAPGDVPEPTAMLLLGVGLFGVGAAIKKYR
jgi:hypothetical protein